MMTGIAWRAGSAFRRRRTSKPSSTGIMMSRMMRSGLSAATSAIASPPSRAGSTWWPLAFSLNATMSRTCCSSSASTILAMGAPWSRPIAALGSEVAEDAELEAVPLVERIVVVLALDLEPPLIGQPLPPGERDHLAGEVGDGHVLADNLVGFAPEPEAQDHEVLLVPAVRHRDERTGGGDVAGLADVVVEAGLDDPGRLEVVRRPDEEVVVVVHVLGVVVAEPDGGDELLAVQPLLAEEGVDADLRPEEAPGAGADADVRVPLRGEDVGVAHREERTLVPELLQVEDLVGEDVPVLVVDDSPDVLAEPVLLPVGQNVVVETRLDEPRDRPLRRRRRDRGLDRRHGRGRRGKVGRRGGRLDPLLLLPHRRRRQRQRHQQGASESSANHAQNPPRHPGRRHPVVSRHALFLATRPRCSTSSRGSAAASWGGNRGGLPSLPRP